MKKLIYILFLLLVSLTAIAQDTPPSGLKAVNAQFYIHLPDSTIWQNKGIPYNWSRVPRWSELINYALAKADTSALKRKSDSTANSGYVTHGYFNLHGLSKLDTVALLATRYFVTHGTNNYFGNSIYNTTSGGGTNVTTINGSGVNVIADGGGGVLVTDRATQTFYAQVLPLGFQATNPTTQTFYSADFIKVGNISNGRSLQISMPSPTASNQNISFPQDASGVIPLLGGSGGALPVSDTTVFARKIDVPPAYQPKLGYTANNSSPPFNRNLVYYGSSLTLAIGSANITSFQQSFAYLTAVAAGYNYLNYGIPGMATQQITAGDNSLFNIYKTIKPPVNSGDVLVLECMVNDIVKAGFDVTAYTTQLTAIVNYLTATTGWPANHIILYNPSYYFTTSFGQADPEGRHTTYTAAVSGIATSLGTLYLDNWSDMRTAQLANPIYVYSDNLHMTQVGQAFAANLLTPFITTNFGSSVDYLVTKSTSIGNLIVQGNQSVFGQLNVNNLNVVSAITNNLPVSISDTRGQAVTAGRLFLGTLNRVSPSGNQQAGLATTYNTGTDASGVYPFNTLNGLAYYTRGDNAADHTWLVGGVVKEYIKGSEGSHNIGYTDGLTHQINQSLLNVNGGGNFSGTSTGNGTKRFMNFIPTVTPTANGTVNVGAYFAPVTNTGTGALTATSTGSTATADGTFTAQPTVNVTGTGSGATYTVTTVAGVPTVITMVVAGTGYAINDTFTIAAIPGITFTVAALGYTGGFTWAAQFSGGPILLASIAAPTNNFSGTLMNISGIFKAYNTVLNRVAMQTDVAGTSTQSPVYNSNGQLTPTTVTGTGAPVLATTPTLVTPVLGVATATSVNKVTITAPATSAVLTILNGKTFTSNNTLTLAGTDATTMTFPTTSATIARTDAANTFAGVQSFTSNPVFNTTSTTGYVWTASNTSGGGGWAAQTTVNRSHTIFTPTTGGTVTLVNNQYNIINPAGALVALTVTLPSSPANNDIVQIKFTQAVTTVTYGGGTVADGITSPIAGGYVIFTYDAGTSTWY